jgi:hypothetical protein
MSKVKSSLGDVVDFEMLKIMSELNAPPVRIPTPRVMPSFANNEPVVQEIPADVIVKQPEARRKDGK